MGKGYGYRELRVWQEAVAIVPHVYALTAEFPREELYGLTSQMRRSATSIASNIAEGSARQTRKEFIQFLYIAAGSIAELETQLAIAVQLEFLNSDVLLRLNEALDKLSRSITKLQQSLRSTP